MEFLSLLLKVWFYISSFGVASKQLGCVKINSTFGYPEQSANCIDAPFEWSPVRALAASFGPVPTKSGSKKMRQHIFLEGAKVAALPLRPPPGVEAKISG